MQIFKKLFFILSRNERKKATLLLIMLVIMALLDVIGVASILPFVAVLSDPSIIESNILLKNLFLFSSRFGINSIEEFLFALGMSVFLLLVISLTFKSLTTYASVRFIFMREHSIGKRLMREYLNQNYEYFISHSGINLGKNILSEVSMVVGNGIKPLIELITNFIIVVSIIVLLIIIDPKLVFLVSLSLGGAYLIIFFFMRKFLKSIGKDKFKNNALRFNIIRDAFGASKEVKLKSLEETYIKKFSISSEIYAKATASSETIAQLPRYLLEAICFGGILLIILITMNDAESFSNSLPIISLYVFAGYRLMPGLQAIYRSGTKLTFINASVEKLYFDLKKLKLHTKKNQSYETLKFDKIINLKNIHYNYPGTPKLSLKNLSLSIPIHSVVGIIGTTGSGKTTLVDIILGLLQPQRGTLEIDNKVLTEKNLGAWQKIIGYVPQQIYLSDDTLIANIALGVKLEDINFEKVKEASKIAKLDQFIVNELPKQYQTIIGEQGIKLSGGQRQRIGIARALYHDPKVLILDEATSALDNETELEVINSINSLNKNITIIQVAHRLNSLKNCDLILKLQNGQIIQQGSFDEVLKQI